MRHVPISGADIPHYVNLGAVVTGTEENEVIAQAILAMLESRGFIAPALDRDEIATEIWTVLDNAAGLP